MGLAEYYEGVTCTSIAPAPCEIEAAFGVGLKVRYGFMLRELGTGLSMMIVLYFYPKEIMSYSLRKTWGVREECKYKRK